jgi:hypothetical protein
MPIVSKFEDLFQVLYWSFSSSPKHHFEFIKLSKIIEIKKFKILQNMKTTWIIMFQTLKWVGKEYKTLIAKMVVDYNSMELANAQVRYNLIFLPIIQTPHTQMRPQVDA